ncbi:aldolase/citrate lyase family protein [Sulfitobacter aestuariivivens]|uniref:Hydroxypyruvate/pyruvate aldolase n=1 Tax=Sulfitobacter aestuariivivens TaxID=2766981 RepID=A0A927D7M0_9RHOB|nr:aldolase/citrate lyase family protein [Sulfitobacter aestuariivivens]MBD3665638.1 2-keto-3-deoxy-L-rhamnonate aldolase [Sulfitobacter aestuariivivens]
MPAKINRLKTSLKAGEVSFGCWLGLADSYAAEIMGGAGFDFLVIDGEHAPNDIRSILAQLQVLAAFDVDPVVRVPVGQTHLIKQVLDLGAQTVLVPMVESAAQARQLLRDITYPPHGDRGVGYAVSRAGAFSRNADYGTTADAQICLLVQVENLRGMAALDDILAVDGVDGVFIGPADLAADMGHMGDAMHADVQATILDAIARIRAAGKAPGLLSTVDAMTDPALEAGAQFVAVGADVLILGQTARALAEKWIARTL